tara:strand:+ start:121 stop:885 length:765 start_codon:yes stop_codon:yes gene_type:complete
MDLLINFPWEYPLLIIVGFIVGIINTMAGGGSLITLPLLIFLGLPSSVANGTNRIAIMMTAFSANMGFKSKGLSTYPFSAYLGVFALVGSIIGANIAVEIEGELFNKILSVIMILVVIIIIFKPRIIKSNFEIRVTGKHLLVSCVSFFFIGLYGGFVNAGIGFIIMLFLHFYNRINLLKVNATKVVVVLVYTIGAFFTFVINDMVDWTYGICLGIGTLNGGWFTSRWSVKKGENVIRIFLTIIVVVMAIKLWFF